MKYPDKFEIGDLVEFNGHQWNVTEVIEADVFLPNAEYVCAATRRYILEDDLKIRRRGIPGCYMELLWRAKEKRKYRSIDAERISWDSEESCEPD